MPELAEVAFQSKLWRPGLGHRVLQVSLHPSARVFADCDLASLRHCLPGSSLSSIETAGKQMLFRLNHDCWLGIHLGMTGSLRTERPEFSPGKHDHLVLEQKDHALVFSDFRMLGRVRFASQTSAPDWWSSIAPPVLSPAFSVDAVQTFLLRRKRSAIKAVLLMQERFPGIGNWMADEILWRAGLHPERPAGSLNAEEVHRLWRECRWVCREALRTVGETMADPPDSWLFPHRWRDGGHCPKTGVQLQRKTIGGRTTCWSPARQPLHPGKDQAEKL